MEKPKRPKHFVELFCGGGIVGLTVAAESWVDHVTMIELDPDVASVWHTIFSDDGDWLAEKILRFDLSHENVTRVLSQSPKRTKERAFQTILKNRTYHGCSSPLQVPTFHKGLVLSQGNYV